MGLQIVGRSCRLTFLMEVVGNAYQLAYRPETSLDALDNKRLVRCQPIYKQNIKSSRKLQRSEKLIHVQQLVERDNWVNCTTFRQQIATAVSFLLPRGWTIYGVAQLFNCDPHTIAMQVKKSNDPQPDGRPPKLNDKEIGILHEEIVRLHSIGVKPTINDLQRFVYDSTGKNMLTNTLFKIIHYKFEDFKTVPGKPMESQRCDVSDHDIDAYYTRLREAIDGVPVNLVYNIDESGEDDFVDAKTIRVIVPASFDGDYAEIPVKRESKRATFIHCISAGGFYLPSMFVVPRKTVDSDMLRIFNDRFYLAYQKKGFATADIIDEWLQKVFFPSVQRQKEIEFKRSGYQGHAVLLLDGFAGHAKAFEKYNLDELGIKLVYLVPHSSHLTQPLDLGIFGIQKIFTQQLRKSVTLSPQTDHIRRILVGMEKASVSQNIISAFEQAGLVRVYSRETCDCLNDCLITLTADKKYARHFGNTHYEFDEENGMWRINI